MDGDAVEAAHAGQPLLGTAQIEGAFQPHAAQHRDVGVGDAAEMVGAEQAPPAHAPSATAGIAAEVAKVGGADEVEVSGWG